MQSVTLFRKGSAGTKTEADRLEVTIADCHVKERFTQIRARTPSTWMSKLVSLVPRPRRLQDAARSDRVGVNISDSPSVALRRHLNERSPDHWRADKASRNRFPFWPFLCLRSERILPCCLIHPTPSRRSLTRRTPRSPRALDMFRMRGPAYAARRSGLALPMRARTARNCRERCSQTHQGARHPAGMDGCLDMPLRGWPHSGDGARREGPQAVPLPRALPRDAGKHQVRACRRLR